MTTNEPTAAAMRTVRAFMPTVFNSAGIPLDDFATYVAEIIDCETRLPELLRTGRALLARIDDELANGPPPDKRDGSLDVLAEFRAALTAAEGA